ncbi:unnamed protein product [Lymnaea stagnalis]|uniref:EGF-like domain-containing protein n=1 Tax=Lymnaea stagnalis TaxID=6523 RepID=A0AAV2I2E4_LYMST
MKPGRSFCLLWRLSFKIHKLHCLRTSEEVLDLHQKKNMNSNESIIISFMLLYIALNCYAETIEDYICSQRFKGSRVDYKERSCIEGEAVGCEDPFPYHNMRDCLKDFYGQSNVCEQVKPCKNHGVCSPILTDNHTRTFKCECASTGFYGDRCDKKCPKDLSARNPKWLPCLQI